MARGVCAGAMRRRPEAAESPAMFSGSTLSFVAMTPEPFAYVTRECAMANVGATVSDAFCTLGAALDQAKVQPWGPPMARYRNIAEGRITIDLGFPVQEAALASLRAAGLQTGMTGGGQAMRALHLGSSEKLTFTYDAVLDAIRASGREPAEEMWERYFSGPETPPDASRTEVLWPVKPAPASYE